MDAVREWLSTQLEPIAAIFRGLALPSAITHWGHPLMMGIVIFAMGTAVGLAGWQGRALRLAGEADAAQTQKTLYNHKLFAKLMTAFIVLGYSGGLLSLVMQGEPILSSYHFWTGSLVISLLGANAVLSWFFGDRANLRTAHAYLGSTALCVMFGHALLGLKLGLSF